MSALEKPSLLPPYWSSFAKAKSELLSHCQARSIYILAKTLLCTGVLSPAQNKSTSL